MRQRCATYLTGGTGRTYIGQRISHTHSECGPGGAGEATIHNIGALAALFSAATGDLYIGITVGIHTNWTQCGADLILIRTAEFFTKIWQTAETKVKCVVAGAGDAITVANVASRGASVDCQYDNIYCEKR